MNARDDMLGRLQSRRAGFTLPQPFYIDPGYFRLDMEMIWHRDWLYVGTTRFDKPGSFFTVQIGEYPVVLVRDLKGTIRAFHTCGIAAAESAPPRRAQSCGSCAPITSGATILTGASCSLARGRGFR